MNPRILFFLTLYSAALSIASGQTVPADTPARVINRPQFVLSDEAIAVGIDGKAAVAFSLDKEGKVTMAVPYAGPSWPCGTRPLKQLTNMWEALKQNVRASRFSPAIKDGKPVASNMEMTFLLSDSYRKEVQRRKQTNEVRQHSDEEWVGGAVVNGKAIKLPKPEYPLDARTNRISGAVSVEVLIDETGKVIRAGAVSGNPLLQANSRDAACDAKFSPTLLEGRPVKVSGIITYNYAP